MIVGRIDATGRSQGWAAPCEAHAAPGSPPEGSMWLAGAAAERLAGAGRRGRACKASTMASAARHDEHDVGKPAVQAR